MERTVRGRNYHPVPPQLHRPNGRQQPPARSITILARRVLLSRNPTVPVRSTRATHVRVQLTKTRTRIDTDRFTLGRVMTGDRAG
jgi:hypothetical protein